MAVNAPQYRIMRTFSRGLPVGKLGERVVRTSRGTGHTKNLPGQWAPLVMIRGSAHR